MKERANPEHKHKNVTLLWNSLTIFCISHILMFLMSVRRLTFGTPEINQQECGLSD